MARAPQNPPLSLPLRTAVFFSYLLVFYLVASLAAPERWWRPVGGGADLWFLSATALAAIRLLETPFFRKPADSLIAVLVAGFTLLAVDLGGLPTADPLLTVRLVAIAYFATILVASLVSISFLRKEEPKAGLRYLPYRISTQLGAPELLFTPAVLISLAGFHDLASTGGLVLLAVWLIVAVSRPIEEIARWFVLWRRFLAGGGLRRIGTVERIDAPNLVRVALQHPEAWTRERPVIAHLPSGTMELVLPLFTQVRNHGVFGTGLGCGPVKIGAGVPVGGVVEHPSPPARKVVVGSLLGDGIPHGEVIGFVVEGSSIDRIKFEIASEETLSEGIVVFCVIRDESVYYQIVQATTEEETFDKNPRGTVRVAATQLGIPRGNQGFTWHSWVPDMNTPVFRPTSPPEFSSEAVSEPTGFQFGIVPGTRFPVHVKWSELASHHAAVLGMTGMGKTELVFDLIREGLREGAKIMCVDFTGEYEARLADIPPVQLGLSEDRIAELDDLIRRVETGEFAAGKEKEQLSRFLERIHPEIANGVDEFLNEEGPGLAIFALEDIANTRVTLRATELYLSEIFRWARKRRRAREILLVLEEAHTIVPEFNLFPRDRSDTMAVVGRLAQIALQGRKFGVGILLVSQRTALVSKTVLSQCNTFFAFSLVDQTSLDFLANVFGGQHLSAIPNLHRRQLVAHGPAVTSVKPVIVEIPFDQAKADASAALDFRSSGAAELSSAEAMFVDDEDDLPSDF